MKSATPPNGHVERTFAMRFTSTPRGARLARRLVSHRLHDWGHPYATPVNDRLTLITAELGANAVRHGRVPGRDFHVRLTLAGGTFRIEVSDTLAEKHPRSRPRPPSRCPSPAAASTSSGRSRTTGVSPPARPLPARPSGRSCAYRPEATRTRGPAAPRPADPASASESGAEPSPATS
ncbi:ATP-binding protein [Streptomyces somaliensis]|uniref:ATP-binding protein n=1 Tax=Streptomyces somaliensis TaxID=78355 RepID=UPI0034E973DE